MAIQILCTKQTASCYQVGQFHPAPADWKNKYLPNITNPVFFIGFEERSIKCVTNILYSHHFMGWSHVSLNACHIHFLSLFWHFQGKFLSNSCINRTRWFHRSTINIHNFVATFKLKKRKVQINSKENVATSLKSRQKYEWGILCSLSLKVCINFTLLSLKHKFAVKLHYKLSTHVTDSVTVNLQSE